MADTLIDKLRAKLDETERFAREACDGSSGGWFVGRKWNVYRSEEENPWGDEEHRLVVWGNVSVQSDHIGHNDPASVLRRVAADRKILELHPLASGEDSEMCETCRYEEDPDDAEPFAAAGYPCPTVRALAEGYGIEVPDVR